MKAVPLDIVGSSKFGRYPKISAESTINMIISDGALVPFSGYKLVADYGGRESRGFFKSQNGGFLILVVDEIVYKVDTNFHKQVIGRLTTSAGDVYITENGGNQIALSDGTFIWVYNIITGSFIKAVTPPSTTDINFIPGYISYQDSYVISPSVGTQDWCISLNNDATQFPTIDAGSGVTYRGKFQTKPDVALASVAFDRQLFIMGKVSTSMFQDSGLTLFPYQIDNSLSIDVGVLSVPTIAVGFGILVWLANNEKAGPTIVFSTGGKPAPISTDGIDFILGDLTKPEDSDAWLFQEDGHIFYQITFFTDNLTLVYDFTTQNFFELTDQNLDHHIAKKGLFFNNKNYFVSYEGGKIYEFGTQFSLYGSLKPGILPTDPTYFEWGQGIPHYRITKNFKKPDSSRFRMTRATLIMEQGMTNQYQEVTLSVSRDGAETWGNTTSQKMNDLGHRINKMQFWQMGQANESTFKFGFISGNPNEYYRNIESPGGPERFVVTSALLEIQDA